MREKIQKIMIRHKRYILLLCGTALLVLLFQLLSLHTGWCDLYADHIYPMICDPVSFLTGPVPFALGEILMYAGAVLVALAILLLLPAIFLRKRERFSAFVSVFYRVLLFIALIVVLIYTTQWLTPYRSSVLGKKDAGRQEFTLEEMRTLYYYVVDRTNEACLAVERDASGNVIYPERSESERQVSAAMNRISDEYPRLKGYYPPIKTALCSDVLDWMWIGGYTYPYTLEMTINKYTSRFYFPTLYAHESAHHKGYYKEHEANFLSYLGCAGSEDPLLRYSACYYVYFYVWDAYQNTLDANCADEAYYTEFQEHTLLQQVWEDVQYADLEAAELYQQDEHPLEDYAEVAEDISETGWETQSEILQDYDYDGVVLLMLQYYDGILY